MFLIQFFGLLCLVVAVTALGFIANIVINVFLLGRRLRGGAKKFSARGNGSSPHAENGARTAGRKKIIPEDEGEYVDFEEI